MTTVFASVAVPRPVRRLFTYTVPADLLPRCRRGVRVVVPFGRRKLTGYILEVYPAAAPPSPGPPLRAVEEVLDREPVLDEEILALTRWASEYYLVAWGEMIRAALPAMQAGMRIRIALTPKGRTALLATEERPDRPGIPRSARGAGREILASLALLGGEAGETSLPALRRRVGPRFTAAALAALVRDGLLIQSETAIAPGARRRRDEVAILARPAPASRVPGEAGEPPVRGERQRALLRLLEAAASPLAVPALLKEAGAGRAALRSLERRGLVTVESSEHLRRPPALELPADPSSPPDPTPRQREAIEAIAALLAERRFASVLLHGVTGSGKTEVYMRSIERAVAAGRRAIYLVPEIGLTPLLARRMRSRFGEVLALLHSGLSAGERQDEWRRIQAGRVQVVLGARSAVFAPLPDLGLVVVDEEHDGSYKQDEYPRYNGRDLAIVRARMAGAVALLGSATPSMESF